MKAMILAAGRGERMRELSQAKPKPLQELSGKPLIAYQLERLAQAGIKKIMINVSYLGEQIMQTIGDGSKYGVEIAYSIEPEILGTAGGVANALPLLEEEPFILTSCDIWHDFDFSKLAPLKPSKSAHLVFVDNPEHNPEGDFCLMPNHDVQLVDSLPKQTYAGIGVFSPSLFRNLPKKNYPIGPIIKQAITLGQVTGEKHSGKWRNIDTPERLKEIQNLISA